MKEEKGKISFIKMHGLGNDYVFIDCFPSATEAMLRNTDIPALARRVSERHTGIGSDGLVLILPSTEADARMRIFNADGSEAQMCGNAIRCVGKYLYESGLCSQPRIFIETLAGIRMLTLHIAGGQVNQVTVNMGVPRVQQGVLPLKNNPTGYMSVNMGNPHAVFFRNSVIPEDELRTLGQQIGTHSHFPEGTNVEFVCVRNKKELDVRVWERGSGITLACGTGACAATVAAIRQGVTDRTVTVHLPGGELQVSWENEDRPVYMTGGATEVFRGELNPND